VLKISTKDVFTDESKWIDFVPENKNTLENFFIIGGKGVLKYQSKACSKLEIIDLNTQKRQEINLPTLGTVSNITGQTNKSIMYYSFESFSTPDTVFEFNTKTYTQKKLDSFNIGNTDISNIVTEQITYKSKDKTPVTMFIVKNKNLIKNGKNKTILYGYGGFNVSQNPVFSGHIIDWINSGGVFAIANLRGGSEYGEKWHQSGILQNKQNVFDDFIAAAEYLIHQKITQPKKLAIQGGSNGGLLVGVVMVQRPELFSAVICQVPLLDMIHYDQLKIAKSWRLEYGDPSDPQQFKFLYNYSPYHHVKNKTSYPAVFLTTAKNDIRVDAMHARKMTAKLQFSNASDKPILLYVDDQAGHGQGKPVSKILDDIADRYAFLDSILGN
jgi:prolyl oligopeptidase